MDQPLLTTRAYAAAYIALLALTIVNVGIGYLDIGWANMFVAVVIATMQAAVIALILMHGLFEKALVRLIIAGALLWFMIFMTLTMTDYITRNWVPIAGK